jgi:YHS domain-containing protein
MNLIRKSALTALMLGAVIGCANEEDAAPKPTGAGTPPSGGAPSSPATKNYPAKATPSAEMLPPPKEAPKSGEPGKAETPPAPSAPPKLEEPKQSSKSDISPTKLTDEELAEIKKLPAAEQTVAIKQAVCPVSGHNLGSMEKPIKVSAEGRTFYLCCGGCEEELKANPKAAIAKLDAQAGKK